MIDGATAYYNLGPLVGEVVPGKSWMSMERRETVRRVRSSFGAGGIFTNPNSLIAVIGAQGTAVRSLGRSDVGGAGAQRVRPPPGPGGDQEGAFVAGAADGPCGPRCRLAHYKRLDYVVAVDDTEHLTQIRTTGAYSVAGQNFTVTATMDMSDYGTPVSCRTASGR